MRSAGSRACLAVALTACGGSSDGPIPLLWVSHGRPVAPATLASNVFFVEARVDGEGPAQALIDTGAPVLLLSPDAFNGKVPIGVGSVGTPTLGNLTLVDVPTVGAGQAGGSFNGLPMGGIVGFPAFGQFATSFDYRARKVIFGDPTVPSGVEVPASIPFALEGGGLGLLSGGGVVSIPKSRVIVSVLIEGEPHRLLVDSGASLVGLRQSLFDGVVTDGRGTVKGDVALVSGVVSSQITRLRSVSVNGVEVTRIAAVASVDTDALFDNISQEVKEPIDGLLGATYLREFYATIDYPGGHLQLRRYSTRDHIRDEFQRVGIELQPSSDRAPYSYTVHEVYPGTDAELQGIATGEELVSIDGVALATVDPIAADGMLLGAVGSTRELAFTTRTLVVRVEELLPLP